MSSDTNKVSKIIFFVVHLLNIVVSPLQTDVTNMRLPSHHNYVVSESGVGFSKHRGCLFLTPHEFSFPSFLDPVTFSTEVKEKCLGLDVRR